MYMMLVKQEKKQIPILMYHSIAQSTNPKFKQFAVPPALFAEHMTYLRQHSYTPINVTQLVCMLSQGKFALPERPVVLTFDDGFADFYTNALPVLQQCGFTATLYIATGFIGSTSLWLAREGEATRPMLTWAQVNEIGACGIECGGPNLLSSPPHTPPLSQTPDQSVRGKTPFDNTAGQKLSRSALRP